MAQLLLPALRDHLVAQGIVRVPGIAGAAPPLWLEPPGGAPAPGEGQPLTCGVDAVVRADITGGIPPGRYGSWGRRPIVSIRFRVLDPERAHELEAAIRAQLNDRRNWLMAGLQVIESMVWREIQPVGSDGQVLDFLAGYLFQIYDQP